MSWLPKPLGEILEQSGRHRAGDRDLPVLSITMKHGLVDQADKFKKRVASSDTSNYRVAYKNELVVGFPIDEGVLGFQTKYPAGIVSPAYDIWKLRSKVDSHIPYLERYLRSAQARGSYASRMQGAVARRRSLTKTDFLNLEIPFPPLDDQIRIAHLLGQVEGLVAQRKQHLQQLDDLLKSVFLKMFGDPILNPHGFPVRKLSEFYVNPKEGTKCGPFGSALKKDELVDAGVPVWNMDNIASDGRMVLPFRMWITADKYDELATYSVKDGDIIISRAGTVGKMCVARMNGQPAIISTNLIRVRLGDGLRPLHFVSLVLYC
ncbi:MAG: restriction endonuclease subunit S, partial [Achromobacter sp.]|nr:restriction endonuclease subunit S [Achromobacter sp.]